MIVLDASTVMAWLMPDENMPHEQAIEKKVTEEGAIVPALWRIEIGNSFLIAARRGRISLQQRAHILQVIARLPIAVDKLTQRHAWDNTLTLADKHALTLYDATYLELATRKAYPLATYDKALRRAAEAEGVFFAG
jgi:predicted nucleic acid-binding protein